MRSLGWDLRAWSALALLLACLSAHAAPAPPARHILDLDLARQPAELRDWGDYRIDRKGSLSLQNVLGQPAALKPTREPPAYAVREGEALWIKFAVPATPDDQRWYLRLPSPGLDLATLYTLGADGSWGQQSSGDLLPLTAWALPHLYPVLPLTVSAAEPTYYVLRIQAGDGFQSPIEFVSDSRLIADQQRQSLLYGIYFGLLAMGGIFALAIGAVLRDAAYGWFGLWAVMATAAVAAAVGVTGLHVWPTAPAWADAAPYVLSVLGMAPAMLFVAESLLLRDRAPRRFWTIAGLALLGGACAAAVGRMSGLQRLYLVQSSVAAMAAVAVGLALWAWWRGDKFGRRLIIALAPLLLALALQLPGIPAALLPAWAAGNGPMLLALGLSVPASFLLLALRSQERRDHRRRIAQLSEIDPTTGLVNDMEFVRRMEALIERATRFGYPSLVALVDFPNFDALRQEFGRQRGVEMLLRLAERLSSIVRSVDTVARVGHSRFGLLVEGPLAASRARAFGAKVLAQCIQPMAGLPQGMILRPRVVLALVPETGSQPQTILHQLEQMLQAAARDTTRCIILAEAQGPVSTPATAPTGPATRPDMWQQTSKMDEQSSPYY